MDVSSFFFNGWTPIARTISVGPLAYVALVLFLRISGKRTLTSLNAFDFVVTVAFGSTLAAILLNKDVSLVQGSVALALLVLLQYLVTALAVRAAWFGNLVKSEPRLVFHQGAFLDRALREERLRRDEVLQAMRNAGKASVDDVEAVVLETNGKLSVLSQPATASPSTLDNVRCPLD
ncbi:MAG: DUF421 domain-containing protein [Candidatus Hydrogenedentes bacterium]|nr:DUF421 domain-containing protein [Candidatus Hydrogenedentota bacterium]